MKTRTPRFRSGSRSRARSLRSPPSRPSPARRSSPTTATSCAASDQPYVLVLLDTSGSMNWAPQVHRRAGRRGHLHLPVPERRLPDAARRRRPGVEVPPGQGGALRGAAEGRRRRLSVSRPTTRMTSAVTRKHWVYRVAATQPAGFFSLPGASPSRSPARRRSSATPIPATREPATEMSRAVRTDLPIPTTSGKPRVIGRSRVWESPEQRRPSSTCGCPPARRFTG